MANQSHQAPERPLPQTHYYSIEYPGYVQQASVSTAIQSLGGQAHIDNVFRRNTPRAGVLLELSLRPHSLFSHPIPADVVATNNLVLKITKRRKKGSKQNGAYIVGEYKTEVVGVMSKTVRFRSTYPIRFHPK